MEFRSTYLEKSITFIIFFGPVNHLIASAVAAETIIAPITYKADDGCELSPEQYAWYSLVKAKDYDTALARMAEVDFKSSQCSIGRTVLQSQHKALICAYAKQSSLWVYMFQYAANHCLFQACLDLWEAQPPMRFNVCSILIALTRASCQGEVSFARWALTILKDHNALDEINKENSVGFDYVRIYPNGESRPCSTSYHYPIHGAAHNDQKEVVSLLLQYGANPLLKDMGHTAFVLAKNASIKEIIIKHWFRKPWILGCIKNSQPQRKQSAWQNHLIPSALSGAFSFTSGYIAPFVQCVRALNPWSRPSDHLKAMKALYECPEIASEGIVDDHGNNVLHASVLASNPILIKLCLFDNPALIESKNKDGLTPLQLAYIKNHQQALTAILDFAYAVRK